MSENRSINEAGANLPGTPEPTWVESHDGVYQGYANFFHLNWTPLDVTIRFGQIVPDDKQPKQSGTQPAWQVEKHALMTMGWGHAKILRDLLSDVIQRYEKLNGELKIPTLPPSA